MTTNLILHLYAFLIILQIFDAYTTYRIIKAGGKELNKVLVKLAELLKPITNAKWAWLAVAKLIAIAAGFLIYQAGAVEVMAIMCAFYVYVCFNNFREMQKQ